MKKKYCANLLLVFLCLLWINTARAQCPQPNDASYTTANIMAATADLSWTSVAEAVDGYNIRYRMVGATVWAYLQTPVNNVTLTGLMGDTDYEFDLESRCAGAVTSGYPLANANPAFDTGVRFTTGPNCPMPQNVMANAVSYNSAQIDWDAVGEAITYEVSYGFTDEGTWINTLSVATNSANLIGLNPETDYDVSVSAVCATGISGATQVVRFQTEALCVVPANLSIGTVTTNTAELTWDATTATDYNVQYRPTLPPGGAWMLVTNVVPPYEVTGLTAGVDYEFDVQANCSNGSSSAFSQDFVRFTTEAISGITVQLKVFLEGPYLGGGIMNNSLNIQGVIPNNQPYTITPFNYSGTETIDANALPSNVIDWVLVEATTDRTTDGIVESHAALLLENGDIVDVNGNGGIVFSNLTAGNGYYYIVRHRNHMDIVSANSITDADGITTYDYTISNEIIGTLSQQNALSDGAFAMQAGDLDGNLNVNTFDAIIWVQQNAELNLYLSGDMDFNVNVNTFDILKWVLNNANLGLSDIMPN